MVRDQIMYIEASRWFICFFSKYEGRTSCSKSPGVLIKNEYLWTPSPLKKVFVSILKLGSHFSGSDTDFSDKLERF